MSSQNPGTEPQIRIEAAKVRLSRLETVETKVKKLNAALANLSVAARPKQLGLIKAARAYVEIIAQEPVQGMKQSLRVIDNELQSFDEGIRARTAQMSDLVLLSGVEALKEVQRLKAHVNDVITRVSAQITASGEGDPSLAEISKARQELEKVPPLGDKLFLIHRVPVAFAGQDQGVKKFTSVGYVNVDALDRQGFSAGTVGGYTVVRKQVGIGINPKALYKEHPTDLDEKTGKPKLVRRTVRDTKQTNKGGKPTRTEFKRERTALDEAKAVLRLLEEKQGIGYTFISQQGASFKGATWFWVMSSADVKRFSKAFPGGHINVRTWGLAGHANLETPSEEPTKKPEHVPPNKREDYDVHKRY